MPYRVLIVEDNALFAKTLVSIFKEDLGYEDPVCVDNALEAQKLLFKSQRENHRFDLVITDMNLKDDSMQDQTDRRTFDGTAFSDPADFGGLKVLQTLRQIHETELCVIISGSRSFSMEEVKRIDEYKDIITDKMAKGDDVYNELVGKVHLKVQRNAYRLFLSYRHQDSGSYVGRIYDSLINEFKFNHKQIFRDLNSIDAGVDFRDALRQGIRQSDTVLVLIGPQWATITGTSNDTPRLFDPSDYVRFEVEEALRQKKHIIPLLVGNSQMPSADQLPIDMIPLTSKNAIRVRGDLDFAGDMKRLIDAIEKTVFRT